MNILVVGNGFDLAHGLPTKYKDFLDYLVKVKKDLQDDYLIEPYLTQKETWNEKIKGLKYKEFLKNSELKKQMMPLYGDRAMDTVMSVTRNVMREKPFMKFQHYTDSEVVNMVNESLDENENKLIDYNAKFVWYFLKGNAWVEYFITKIDELEENWIDFEKEITNVVGKIEELIDSNDIELDTEYFKCFGTKNMEEMVKAYSEKKMGKVIDMLKEDLDVFTDLFEFYLLIINQINKIDVKLKLANIDKVISFNYTSLKAYKEKYYKSLTEEDVAFIHGKAGEHNLVLGAAETLHNQDDINNKKDCIKIKKKFQRRLKKTDLKYTKWLKEPAFVNGREMKNNIYILGHSLDSIDKDLLVDIIKGKTVAQTIIYYHDDNAYEKYMVNLVSIIGNDELMKRLDDENIILKEQETTVAM